MTQHNTLNVKLSNAQLNKLKLGIKNGTELTLNLSSNADSNDETNFPQKLLLTDRQVLRLRKAFANNLLANIKLSRIEMPKIVQSREYLSRFHGPLLKNGLPLMKNVFKPLSNHYH